LESQEALVKLDETKWIVFASLFVVILGIFSGIATREFVSQVVAEQDNDYLDLFDWALDFIDRIPLISNFFDLLYVTVSFIFVHDYIVEVLTVILGIPITYILLRLVRGGG
jgi:hypothetical protein